MTRSPTARPSPTAVRAADRLRAAVSRLRRRLRALATDDELTPGQASVLAWLSKQEPATASGLAALEGVRPQSMAATVVGLERLGLVERTPDPSDGRRQLVRLTAAGRDRDGDNRAARREWLATVIDERLTEAERQQLIDAIGLLERLVAA